MKMLMESWRSYIAETELRGPPLLREASDAAVDDLMKYFEENGIDGPDDIYLPFGNIFEDKWRLAVPWKAGGPEAGIPERIRKGLEAKGYTIGHDVQKKTVKFTPPGGGPKQTREEDRAVFYATNRGQKSKLGKTIRKEFGPDSEEYQFFSKKSYLYSKSPEDFYTASGEAEYTFIVTRHPVDIYRMSDHAGWSSCHSPGAAYGYCAVQDAKGTGLVAYLVNTQQLEKFLDGSSLDAHDEIFADPERGLTGIAPLARLRLRRYMYSDETNIDIAVPETRVYGKKLPGLRDFIADWAVQKQKPVIKQIIQTIADDYDPDRFTTEEPTDELLSELSPSDFYKMGGAYSDSSDSLLLSNFFDADVAGGYAKPDPDVDDYGPRLGYLEDDWTNEVDEILKDYRSILTHYDLWATVDVAPDGGDPYVSMGAWVAWPLPKDFDYKKWQSLDWRERRAIQRELNSRVEFHHVDEMDIALADHSFELTYTINPDTDRTPEGLRELAEYLSDRDNEYAEDHVKFLIGLEELGFIKSSFLVQLYNFAEEAEEFTWDPEEPHKLYTIIGKLPYDLKHDQIMTWLGLGRSKYEKYLTSKFVEFFKKFKNPQQSTQQFELPLQEAIGPAGGRFFDFQVVLLSTVEVAWRIYLDQKDNQLAARQFEFVRELDTNYQDIFPHLIKFVFGEAYNIYAKNLALARSRIGTPSSDQVDQQGEPGEP